MINALSRPKTDPKPKTEPKQKAEPKQKIIINKKKLEEIRKDFYELRHKFSKKELDRYRKICMILKTPNIFQYQK